jgi:hypothetical protein
LLTTIWKRTNHIKKKRMTIAPNKKKPAVNDNQRTKNIMTKTGERAIDIIQYNRRKVQNEVYIFFPKVHV